MMKESNTVFHYSRPESVG